MRETGTLICWLTAGLAEKKEEVKKWYDGYTFGEISDIYNPWSITFYLKKKKLAPYWVNTSNNALISSLLWDGDTKVKGQMANLLKGKPITAIVDEEIVFSRLKRSKDTIWSLMVTSGYLKITGRDEDECKLEIVNLEVYKGFQEMIHDWFGERIVYHQVLKALITGDVETMNKGLNELIESMISFYDVDKREPEKFYHGFILGLVVDLNEDYIITSNLESGKGRYDIAMEPRKKEGDAFILEFKVVEKEQDLEKGANTALDQIEENQYDRNLIYRGYSKEKIKKYGLAFSKKSVLVKAKETP